MSVQNLAEVIVEADGYNPYTELLSIPPNRNEPLQHHVTPRTVCVERVERDY